MRRSAISWSLGAALLCCGLPDSVVLADADEARPSLTETLGLGLRGVYFVPNQGQWSESGVQYGLRSRGLDVAFRESSFTMHLRREKSGVVETDSGPSDTAVNYDVLTLGVTFPGSNSVLPRGTQPQPARFNFYLGDDDSKWATDVPSFASVIYKDLYEGIDLAVSGSDGGVLKYEFHCDAGSDISRIRVAYEGIESLCINGSGDLQIETSLGTLCDRAPLVWQDGLDCRTTIPARFDVVSPNTYTITVLEVVDPSLDLVIDPPVEWMYYLGGSRDDQSASMAIDSTGALLLTGTTSSRDFEGAINGFPGGSDSAFVLKVSPDGELQWMSYFGGGASENGHQIVVDADDNAIVAGSTMSSDFGGHNNTYHGGSYDGFALKVDHSGALVWMTFLGGSLSDRSWSIDIDGHGDLFLAGHTQSTDFEGRINEHHGGSFSDGFLLRLSGDGVIRWMTYLGGTGGGDAAYGVCVNDSFDIYVTGETDSLDFFNTYQAAPPGGLNAFILKVDYSGDVDWIRYLGGSNDEGGNAVTVDHEGNIVVLGDTTSGDFVGRINSYSGLQDAFMAKYSPSGAMLWMRYIGGTQNDWGHFVTTDSVGNIFISGRTFSTQIEGQDNSSHGRLDAVVAKYDSDGVARWMTFLGGGNDESGYGLAAREGGTIFISGITASRDFEGQRNSFYGDRDAYILRIHDVIALNLDVDAACPEAGPVRVTWHDATPGGQVALVHARHPGSYMIPWQHPCAGTELGLDARTVRFVGYKRSNPAGRGQFIGTFRASVCGRYLQLLDLTTCATSNVTRIE